MPASHDEPKLPVCPTSSSLGKVAENPYYRFARHVNIDTTPMPDNIPKVPEIGATSAPLFSAAYFIGARCRPYSDDYMVCKTEASGRGELECMREGRKVTRCAASVYAGPVTPMKNKP